MRRGRPVMLVLGVRVRGYAGTSVSTFEPLSSGWLPKDLVERLRKETGVPVEHVTVAKTETEVPA